MFFTLLKDVSFESIIAGIVLAFVISMAKLKNGEASDEDSFAILTLKCIAVIAVILMIFHA